jgi:hypothetical protein
MSARALFLDGYPAMAPISQNGALLGILDQVNTSLGFSTMPEFDPMKRGAGDISFIRFHSRHCRHRRHWQSTSPPSLSILNAMRCLCFA